jgi:hypothetical protein
MPPFTDHWRSSKRALRRHHRQRMIQRAQRKFAEWGQNEPEIQAWARRNHDHLKACSCPICGNPRKWEGLLPTQQRRQLLAAQADAAEA